MHVEHVLPPQVSPHGYRAPDRMPHFSRYPGRWHMLCSTPGACRGVLPEEVPRECPRRGPRRTPQPFFLRFPEGCPYEAPGEPTAHLEAPCEGQGPGLHHVPQVPSDAWGQHGGGGGGAWGERCQAGEGCVSKRAPGRVPKI